MLFYNQIKRVFSQTHWKHGQVYFREERVRDVRLRGNQVAARIEGQDGAAYTTALVMGRGTIFSSQCNCPERKNGHQGHCPHVAALGIWVIERGSLLRSGIGSREDGVAEEELDSDSSSEKAKAKPIEPEVLSIRAEPVLLVRGLLQNKVLTGISIEAAARFNDPKSHEPQVESFTRLVRHSEPKVWRNTHRGVYLKLTHEILPILQNVDAQKIHYDGPETLEHLARLLKSEFRGQMVFHPSLEVEFDSSPLKLVSLNVGRKTEKFRLLSYVFENENDVLTSAELAELATQGRLSNHYVWKGKKLYRFEVPLSALARYANRSGIARTEQGGDAIAPDGYAYLDDDGQHPLHPLAAYRLSLELGVENFTVDPDWREYHDWRKNFERAKIPLLPKVEYGFDLRDYQHNGLSWLWSLYHRRLAALLADDMGLGKTHQVLAFLTSLYSARNKPKKPSLVIAPTSVVAAWSQKLHKYDTRLKWYVFHGKSRVFQADNVDLVLTTYGILQKEALLREQEWHVVILDEAQAIKNSTTISSRASRILRSAFKIAMTGTPVENQSTDLWSIMEFLLPGYLGSLPRFKRLYGSGRDIPSEVQARGLKKLVSPFLLRRTKVQVLKELPEKTEEVITCEMSAAQKKIYQSYLSSAEANKLRDDLKSNGKVDYASILALLTRLKQVCDHPKLPEFTSGKIKRIQSLNPLDTGKWEVFEELLNEALGSNLKVVVFTQYLGMLDLLAHHLKTKEVGFVELRGDTLDRSKPLKEFSENPECKVFLCSLLAGGLGIDLTSASVCIHFDRWWNPAKENQATDRLHRIGQTRGVQVFKLQVKGTIEDRIADIIQSKIALSGTLIEESPVWLKAFSRQELLELLEGSRESS
ncbi:MAG: DEAD/DEAH box helicase [Bdellovibrionota bacterium]